MTSLKQIQTPKQIIQETENKIKKAKKLENILMGGAVLGLGTAITGLSLDNETLGEILSVGGIAAGAFSVTAGFYTILGRKILETYLQSHNKSNKNSASQYNSENKFNDNYK